jgi:hypothetical protein
LREISFGGQTRGYSAQINTNTRSSDKLFTAIVYLQLRQLSLSLS